MSTLKVNTIQDTTGNDALTIDSSGNVTASQGFVPSTQLSHRNLIINGAMQVAQRGTSFSSNNSIDYTVDRWAIFSNGISTTTQESFTVGQTDVPNEPLNYLKWNISTFASGDNLFQRIEGVRTGASQTITLSFYAKADSSITNRPRIIQNFGSGGSSEVSTETTTNTLTTSWQKFSITTTLPSISGKTIGTSNYLEVEVLRFTDSFTGGVYITEVQLEVGSVATPFEHRSYGEELARCQRYYSEMGRTGYMSGRGNGTSSVSDCLIPSSTTMRTYPTITGGTWYMTKGSSTTLYNGTGETYSVNSVSSHGIVVDINSISNGTDNMVEVIQVLSVTLDAEL